MFPKALVPKPDYRGGLSIAQGNAETPRLRHHARIPQLAKAVGLPEQLNAPRADVENLLAVSK